MQPALSKNQIVLTINPNFYRIFKKIKHTKVNNTTETENHFNKGSIIIYGQKYGRSGVARVIGQAEDSFILTNKKLYLNGRAQIEHGEPIGLYKRINEIYIRLERYINIIIPDDYCLVRHDSPSLDYAGDIVTLAPTDSILGYVKFILWDKKNRKFIGKFLG